MLLFCIPGEVYNCECCLLSHEKFLSTEEALDFVAIFEIISFDSVAVGLVYLDCFV